MEIKRGPRRHYERRHAKYLFHLVGPEVLSRAGRLLSLKLRIADIFKALWADSGLTIRESTYDGMRCFRPDYWVMRLGLLGMSPKLIDELVMSSSHGSRPAHQQRPESRSEQAASGVSSMRLMALSFGPAASQRIAR